MYFSAAATAVIAAISFDVRGSAAPQDRPVARPASTVNPSASTAVPDQQAVLAKYCVTCHNQRAKTGGLALDTLDLANLHEHAEVWEQVVRKVRTGAMPPVGRPRPDSAVAKELVAWLETGLDRAALEHVNPGRPSLHRLNRAEYSNVIRDLLAVEIDAASMLPADVAGHGFDNNADALTLSPALTERYLGAAAKISQMALGRPRGLPTPETFFVPTDRDQDVRVSDDLPFGSRGGLAVRYYFPADGEYLFQMMPKENGVAGGFEGITAEPHQLNVGLDNVKVWTGTVGGPELVKLRGDERDKKVIESMRFRVPVKAGSHLVQVYFTAKTTAYFEDLFDRSLRRDPYRAPNGQTNISTLTITGPQPETVAVSESPSRRRVLTCTPVSADNEAVCAKKIISNLARRAYRRPVTEEDLQVLLASYRAGSNRGGFESGLEMALRSILVSPDFLFRLESQTCGDCAQHAISSQRFGPGLETVVFPVEQHPRRRALAGGGEGHPAQA